MSDATRWRHVEALLDEAAHIAPPDRPAFLDGACRRPDGTTDAALREEVEALLALDPEAAQFFEDARGHLASVAGHLAEAPGDEPEDAAPERVGPWRLVRPVGRGGMGTVFLAHRDDGRFDQTAAVKLVRPGLAPGLVARFRAERQILARLDHPAIARLLDGGQTDDDGTGNGPAGRPYLVMEYVDGLPITDYCDRRRLGVNERLALFEAVCEAVQFAHSRLVVHRDLKPSNVMVAETEAGPRVKLLDFGIAKLLDEGEDERLATAPDQRVMTPEYAAPEQVRGEAVTTATDVYALGVLLYELLTGRRPHSAAGRLGGGRHAVERAILETEPVRPSEAVTESAPTGGRVPPDPARLAAEPAAEPGGTGALRATTAERLRRRLRGDLDRIVLRALAKEPARRYEGAGAFGADVRRHLAGLPVEARADTVAYRVSKFVRRHRGGVAALLVALLAVVGGAGVALWQAAEARAAQARAETEAETSDEVAALLENILREADPERTRGADVTVREALDRGAVRVRTELADRPAVRARLLEVVGMTYAQIGLPSEGLPLVAEALEVRLAAGGADPVALAQIRHNLAGLHLMLGDADAAEPLLQSALATWRTLPIGASPSAFKTLSNLGAIRLQRGDLAGATRALSESIRQALLTDGATDLLPTLLQNLASLEVEAGHYALADSLYREAVRQGTEALGSDHPHVIIARNGLAATQLYLGRVAESERAFTALTAELSARYPDQTTRRSLAESGLGNALLAQERFAEAERHYAEALRLHLVEMPQAHPLWASVQTERAYIRLRTGTPAEALVLAQEARAAVDPARLSALDRARGDAILGAALQATGGGGTDRMRAAQPVLRRLLPPDEPFLRFIDRQLGTEAS